MLSIITNEKNMLLCHIWIAHRPFVNNLFRHIITSTTTNYNVIHHVINENREFLLSHCDIAHLIFNKKVLMQPKYGQQLPKVKLRWMRL